MGNVVVDLGGGRRVENDVIDPSVGIDHVLPLGTAVGRGDVIARVHANRLDRAQAAVKALENIILMVMRRWMSPLFWNRLDCDAGVFGCYGLGRYWGRT